MEEGCQASGKLFGMEPALHVCLRACVCTCVCVKVKEAKGRPVTLDCIHKLAAD